MHLLDNLLLITLSVSPIFAAKCNNGRFGGVTEAEVLAVREQIFQYGMTMESQITFAANAPSKDFVSGECTAAVRHDQAEVEGSIYVPDILKNLDQIEAECVEPQVKEEGGRGWGGEVTGIFLLHSQISLMIKREKVIAHALSFCLASTATEWDLREE
ncbi:MAG: hypothetical protein Q9209_002989 [Squamulea sp. 1 TL-2023]